MSISPIFFQGQLLSFPILKSNSLFCLNSIPLGVHIMLDPLIFEGLQGSFHLTIANNAVMDVGVLYTPVNKTSYNPVKLRMSQHNE